MEFNCFNPEYCNSEYGVHDLSEVIFYKGKENSYYWSICKICGRQVVLSESLLDKNCQSKNT